MTENAGTDPRVAAAEEAAPVEPDQPETDATQRMEDPAAAEDEPERLYEA